jgi:arylsulfatase A-like enzyme
MVHMLDRQVGELFALLEELAIEHNTIVIFCGDNGGQDYFRSKKTPRGFHGPNVDPRTGVEFRGQKGTLYEGGLRIPAIVRWPGQIEAGQVSDHQWYFPDMMPTLLGLAGLQSPADTDGISIEKELLGQPDEQLDHPYLYWELGARRAVRMNDWKAIRPARGKPWALYQLSTDPSERNDLSQQHPEILAQLQGYAREAHQPAQQGTFADKTLHLRDRQAKQGFKR